MFDPRVEKLADVLVNYSVAVRPGDKVLLRSETTADPLIRAVYTKVIQAGGLPYLQLTLPGLDEIFYRHASNDQLKFVHEPQKMIYETYDAQIILIGSQNTKALTNVEPERMVMHHRARSVLSEIFSRRAATKELRWTLTLFPTHAHAQDAEMSLTEYEDFVYSACLPDMDDPIGYWKKFSAQQQKIVDWLQGREKVHILGPDTDLKLSIAGRTFINCDGHENMPDGEVFTGPVENSIEGHVCFSYPTIYDGREVTGVRLRFENGKIVHATADKNEAFLIKTLDTDEGSRYLGEFAIGTNTQIQKFTGEILFDEKIGGSFHMAAGDGYPETGSTNKSAIHWDMICDLRNGGEIWVDDQLFYKDGQFTIL